MVAYGMPIPSLVSGIPRYVNSCCICEGVSCGVGGREGLFKSFTA